MKKYINKILIFIWWIVIVWSVAFAATVAITSFTQTVNDWDTITSTWYNNVNTKLKWTYSSWKWCTSDTNGTIQCVNDVPSSWIVCTTKQLTWWNYNWQTLYCDTWFTMTWWWCQWRSDWNDWIVYSHPNWNWWFCQDNDFAYVPWIFVRCCK